MGDGTAAKKKGSEALPRRRWVESEQLRRYWIPSLAEGDSVKPPSLPGGRILPAL